MSSYDFRPSINSVRFINLDSGEKNIHKLTDFEGTLNIGMELEIGGLNFINTAIENDPIPFFITIVTYSQDGGRGIILHGFNSIEYSKDRLIKGDNEDSITIDINNFYRNHDLDTETGYDFVISSFNVSVLYTEVELKNSNEIAKCLSSTYNVIFHTKLPFVNKSLNIKGEFYDG